MSTNIVPSIQTLPVEILHRIFDNLDSETILFSIRPVCRLFRSIISTYDRYVLDFQLISKSSFYLFCRLIKPENVISLILSNNERTSNQIDLFISLVRLQQFTRLLSLTLLDVDEGQLNFILKSIKLNSITSLSFSIREYDDKQIKITTVLLSLAVASSTVHRLEFGIEPTRMSKILWPSYCTIQYLTLNNYISIDNFCTILQNSLHLHTLILNHIPREMMKNSSSIFFPQIKSLTIKDFRETIHELEIFLLLTPSLDYLKIIGGKKMMDGKRWEQFIQINLPQLDKFEFYFIEYTSRILTTIDVELTIASFQTPFWTEHKKWFVICECDIDGSYRIDLYSIPICKPGICYAPKSKRIALSTNSLMMNKDELIMKDIKSLTLTWNKSTANDTEERKASNRLLFPKVTEIDLQFRENWPLTTLQSLSVLIDMSRLVSMKISGDNFYYYNQNICMDISMVINQAHNLSLLYIQRGLYSYDSTVTIENIHSILPCYIKCLQIPINNLDQIKLILERCKKLSTINLDINSVEFCKDVIQWFADNTTNTSCTECYRRVTVWLGRKNLQSTETTVNHKRIKLTDKN